MKINITGHHVEITEGIKTAVDNNLKRILRHYPDITSIHIILTVEKKEQKAEAVLHFLGQDIVAHASSEDLYHSLSELKGKLEIVLEKRKSTIKAHPHVKPESAETDEDELEVELDD
jgi:putative sigma-54 modulation protein